MQLVLRSTIILKYYLSKFSISIVVSVNNQKYTRYVVKMARIKSSLTALNSTQTTTFTPANNTSQQHQHITTHYNNTNTKFSGLVIITKQLN